MRSKGPKLNTSGSHSNDHKMVPGEYNGDYWSDKPGFGTVRLVFILATMVKFRASRQYLLVSKDVRLCKENELSCESIFWLMRHCRRLAVKYEFQKLD
mmetsp:Transcript_302/g.315  ORF Transcript_302/g.315 Transcript_302/m.315 type:complete len:98 (-) Transcript_302:670-963(-)